MSDPLYVEEVRRSITRRTQFLGLTATEWVAVFLVSGNLLYYLDGIERRLFFLKLSHFAFLAASVVLYLGVLFLHARKPPRYAAHALRFLMRKKYLIAQGLHEKKRPYIS